MHCQVSRSWPAGSRTLRTAATCHKTPLSQAVSFRVVPAGRQVLSGELGRLLLLIIPAIAPSTATSILLRLRAGSNRPLSRNEVPSGVSDAVVVAAMTSERRHADCSNDAQVHQQHSAGPTSSGVRGAHASTIRDRRGRAEMVRAATPVSSAASIGAAARPLRSVESTARGGSRWTLDSGRRAGAASRMQCPSSRAAGGSSRTHRATSLESPLPCVTVRAARLEILDESGALARDAAATAGTGISPRSAPTSATGRNPLARTISCIAVGLRLEQATSAS
ncbi:hypothetical protein ABMA10_03695 [Plantibacter sp. RU18]